MKKIKIAIIREEKIPHDRRVAFTPQQCLFLKQMYPNIDFIIQPCPYRSISDEEYVLAGLKVSEDISTCDIMMGIKEVPPQFLMEGKTYLFFSHTIKKQPHNRELLRTALKRKIRLIDYECLVDENDNRIIGFGRFAGIVGAYNSMRAFGIRYHRFKLKPAQDCEHKAELEKELRKAKLDNIKILLTGGGRVANGALEILGSMKVRRITPYELLMFNFTEPVYAQIHSADYNMRADGQSWNKQHFYQHPELYVSTFKKFAEKCHMLIHCAFWNPKAPVLFSLEDMKQPWFRIKVIGDITCDINGSIPSTMRATTIEDPFFEFDPMQGKITTHENEHTITTMAVDNLPCSLPRDASEAFGKELIEKVMPSLLLEPDHELIAHATIADKGKLTERFAFLNDYASVN